MGFFLQPRLHLPTLVGATIAMPNQRVSGDDAAREMIVLRSTLEKSKAKPQTRWAVRPLPLLTPPGYESTSHTRP